MLKRACINIYWQNPEFPVQFVFDFVTRRCQRYHELSIHMYDIEETELMDESDEKEHFRGFLLQISRFCNTREETLSSVMGCRHSWHVGIYSTMKKQNCSSTASARARSDYWSWKDWVQARFDFMYSKLCVLLCPFACPFEKDNEKDAVNWAYFSWW